MIDQELKKTKRNHSRFLYAIDDHHPTNSIISETKVNSTYAVSFSRNKKPANISFATRKTEGLIS